MAGIYIHIPYCRHKCAYCDFYSQVNMKSKPAFLHALTREMLFHKAMWQDETIETIYFGGGTPSLLDAHEIQSVLTHLRLHFKVSSHPEITLEVNPEDVSREWATQMRKTEVNRISIGLQSFHQETLNSLGRIHTEGKAHEAIQIFQVCSFTNLTADIIYGIPGQSDEKLLEDLSILQNYQIPHISAYALTVEEKTPLALKIKKSLCLPPDEDQMARQFYLVRDFLEQHAFHAYEISNYCLPGHEAQHNRAYWRGEKYLGLGPSAHTFNGSKRWWNVAGVTQYIEGMQCGSPVIETESINPTMAYNEYVLTRLRTMEGIDLEEIESIFGKQVLNYLMRQAKDKIQDGHILNKAGKLCLSRRGLLLADFLSSGLFLD